MNDWKFNLCASGQWSGDAITNHTGPYCYLLVTDDMSHQAEAKAKKAEADKKAKAEAEKKAKAEAEKKAKADAEKKAKEEADKRQS